MTFWWLQIIIAHDYFMIENSKKIKQKEKTKNVEKIMTDKKNSYKLHSPVFLVGMMGSGKSKVGKLLADELAVNFVDSDEAIIKAEGKSISDIFMNPTMGEAYFRKKETLMIKKIIATAPVNKIIAGGGGAFINPAVNTLLRKKNIVTLYIDTPLWVLWMRVKNGKDRPLLKDNHPKQKLRAIYNARRPIYLTADMVLSSIVGSKKRNMARLLSILINYGIVQKINKTG